MASSSRATTTTPFTDAMDRLRSAPATVTDADLIAIWRVQPDALAGAYEVRVKARVAAGGLETKAIPTPIHAVVSPAVAALRQFLRDHADRAIRPQLSAFAVSLEQKLLVALEAMAADGFSEQDLGNVLDFERADIARRVEEERARLLAGARSAR